MSLLHEALKKAEKEKESLPEGEAFVDLEVEGERKRPLRLYVLIGLTVVGLLCVAYLELYQRGSKPAVAVKGMEPGGFQMMGVGIADLTRQSDVLLGGGHWEGARPLLEKLVLLEPRNPEAYNNLGLVLKKAGDKRAAHENFQKALALKPDYPEAFNNLGSLYLSDGKILEAEDHFRKALGLKPDYAEATFNLALTEEAQGKGDLAKTHFAQFLGLSGDLEPDFATAIRERMTRLGLESGP